MSYHTDLLINSRSKCRKSGWLLSLVGLAGLLFVGFVAVRTLLTPLRRHTFDLSQSDVHLLVEGGNPTPLLYGLGMVFAVCVIAGNLRLSKARRITKELQDTEAEVSRRLRVEEALRERGRARA